MRTDLDADLVFWAVEVNSLEGRLEHATAMYGAAYEARCPDVAKEARE